VFRFLILCLGQSAGGPKLRLGRDPTPDDGKLRIIRVGAHSGLTRSIRAGGCGLKLAKLGHHVKLVSVTNGDHGHEAQCQVARWRNDDTAEVERPPKIIGTHCSSA